MSTKTVVCRACGDAFKLTREQQELSDNGWGTPETCDECGEMEPPLEFPEQTSDADTGL